MLDVGSGGKPYPRSDILLDRVTGAAHRCGAAMMIDRPTVFGDASRMPFKDQAFDFVVASHILEHMAEPEIFLAELQRVGKAGYIETPNVIFERLHPYSIHCLEVASIKGVLHIHKKERPVEDPFLGGLGLLEHAPPWQSFFFETPEMFHVRHFWKLRIDYKIHNPETSCQWIEAINAESEAGDTKDSYLEGKPGWREYGLKVLGSWQAYRRARRLRDFDIFSVLACPECKGDLQKLPDRVSCPACKVSYPLDPYPDFTQPK